jgi:hypothetical protein
MNEEFDERRIDEARLDEADRDPIEHFNIQLEVAKLQASRSQFPDAYRTLVVAYDNLIQQHEEVIEELLELRKKLADEIYNRNLWRKKATGI